MRKLLLTALVAATCLGVRAQGGLSIEDMCSGKYYGRQMAGITPLGDGLRYARISDDRRQIVAYSFKTGEQTEVLADLSTARAPKTIERIDGYIMSPDEKNILIQTETVPIYRHSKRAVYYVYNVRNQTLKPLSDGEPQECPVWSPDGYMVAFVRENNIFLVKLLFDMSESQVTKDGELNSVVNGKPDWVNEEEFVNDCSLTFTADNEMLCWIRYDESQVPLYSFTLYKGLAPEREEYGTYPGVYEYKYPVAGAPNSLPTVMSYDIKSHATRQIKLPLPDEGYVPRIFATSDETKLAVVTLNKHQDCLSIYMANPRSTECTLAVRDEVDKYIGEAAYNQMLFFAGGFVMTSERSGRNHVYVYDLNGTLKREATPGDVIVTDLYGYDPKTSTCYYAATDEGNPLRRAVYKSDQKGKITKLSTEEGTNSATFSANYEYFINVYSSLTTPPLTTLRDAKGKTLRTLIDNSDIAQEMASKSQATKEFFTFTTLGGTTLNGYMVKPADFSPSRQYPAILFQYSGPGSQQVVDSWNTGNMGGMAYEQYLASLGFISVCVDGRGTGGRGADFEKQTYLRLGQMEAADQVEVASYVGSLPYIDAERIGIWGWSFGGYCTLMAMSEGKPTFKAGVAVAPVTNYRYYDSIYTERFMRTPKENPDGYDDCPVSRASKLNGKLLLCHGLADDNVHFRNTAEYTEALVEAGKDFKELTYTNRNHGIAGGKTREHLFGQITQWFQDNL